MSTVRVTAGEAVVRFLAAQRVETPAGEAPLFGGVFAIFGHGIVAGLGEALYRYRSQLPTYRAHNEQAMAHTAIAYAKAHLRRRMMAVTTSVGPGATNLVTAAATAHVNRLPLLLLPADVFASRAPDPVLQQVEGFSDGTLSANDCFRPVSRYFDRITRPEQLITALPRALRVLTDPAECGPVTLALCQDVEAMACEYPAELFEERTVHFRAPPPDEGELDRAVAVLKAARRPIVIAGGGVIYGQASEPLRAFADAFGVPVAETLAGKGSLAWDHPLQAGGIGHTGVPAANDLAREADLVLGVGTRLGDFTTASHTLFPQARVVGLNVTGFDAAKWWSTPLQADARLGLTALRARLSGWKADPAWTEQARRRCAAWKERLLQITSRRDAPLPYDGEVIGAVQRFERSTTDDIVVTAGGTIPNELQKLWRTSVPGGCHIEYGYSCMGYEIAGGIGVKMAHPEREVIVILGDGAYLMMNSEIATSVLLGQKIIVVVEDNHGYGCINRLQQHCGGEPFNNLFQDCAQGPGGPPAIDFAMHARSLGALGENVKTIPELEAALARARKADRTTVICIETDPARTTTDGAGAWWEVGVPEVSPSEKVRRARQAWEQGKRKQKA